MPGKIDIPFLSLVSDLVGRPSEGPEETCTLFRWQLGRSSGPFGIIRRVLEWAIREP